MNRLLKLDPSNTELLTQKQKLLKDAVSSTKEKLDTLKTAQEQAKAQLESGDLGQDKYDALQREIIETEQELKRLQEQAIESNAALAKIEEVGGKLEKVGDSISGAGKKMLPVTAGITALGTAAVTTAQTLNRPCRRYRPRWVSLRMPYQRMWAICQYNGYLVRSGKEDGCGDRPSPLPNAAEL